MKKSKWFVLGMVSALILSMTFPTFAAIANQKISVFLNSMSININKNPLKVTTLTYNGVVFAPVKNIAEACGKSVTIDSKGKVISINEKVIKPSTSKPKPASKKVYGDLTDTQIKEAIKIGSSGFDEALEYTAKNYALTEKSSTTLAMDAQVDFITPYKFIIESSALNKSKYEDYTLDEAHKFLEGYKKDNLVYFCFNLWGDSITFHKNYNYILMQNGKIIKPVRVTGDTLADTSSSWPEYPAYTTSSTVSFNMNKIDFSKSAELILIQLPDCEKHYTIDFSKYK